MRNTDGEWRIESIGCGGDDVRTGERGELRGTDDDS